MSHFAWVRRRLARSLRVKVGMLMLATIALPAIFAELIAAPVPIVAGSDSGIVVLPAVWAPTEYVADWGPNEIRGFHDGHFAVWPLLPSGPDTVSAQGPNAGISSAHWLGTDARGRDLFVRLVYGGRVALGIAVLALLFSLLLGGTLGGLAGYFGGFWDELLARPIEVVETFPSVFVVAVVRAAYPDGSLWSLAIAVAMVKWAEVARLVRAEVVKTSASDFVLAARAWGCGHGRLLWRHILPFALRPTLETSLFGVASIVILEVSVSFLGLGPDVSWGATIADGIGSGSALRSTFWAGLVLVTTVSACYLLADAIGEAIDARLATTER